MFSNMSIAERIKIVIKSEGITLKWLSEQSGVGYAKWQSVFHKGTRVNEEHISAVSSMYPEYLYWVVTGKTLEQCGQISPDIKEFRRLQKTLKKQE